VAELILKRQRSYFGAARGVVVKIDGERAATVKLGDGERLQLPEGPHQLDARMDWVRSEILPFELHSLSTTTIRISAPFWRSMIATVTAGKTTTFGFDVTTG
jgi:hypothetical protein